MTGFLKILRTKCKKKKRERLDEGQVLLNIYGNLTFF